MKKILGIIALVVITMGVMVACNQTPKENHNNQTSGNIQTPENTQISGDENDASKESGETILEPANPDFEVNKVFDSVKTISGLEDSTRMSDAEIKENYKFGKYAGLQKEIRSKETENSFTEIAIIKVGENEQSLDLFQIISARIYDLQQKYAENEKVLSILNNNDNIIIKQQAGILIAIISDNAKQIEEEIDKQF